MGENKKMVNENSCSCSSDECLILACSGASNVGQLTNEVAKRLSMEGLGKFFCIVGVGAHISGMVESVRGTKKILVLDGCPAQCAKKCLDHEGFSIYSHLVITDYNIKKNHDFFLNEEDINNIRTICKQKLFTDRA